MKANNRKINKKEPNEIPLSPENTFLIIFLVILIPLILTGFLSQ